MKEWLRARRRAMAPKPSTRRRIKRGIKRSTVGAAAVGTFVSAILIAQPISASAAGRPHPPAAKPYVDHQKVIGKILSPKICTPGPSTPPPSASTLAYLAEPSNNEVQVVDEATGAFVGSPIAVGTSPKGIAYWQPAVGSTRDPLVIVANNGANSHDHRRSHPDGRGNGQPSIWIEPNLGSCVTHAALRRRR